MKNKRSLLFSLLISVFGVLAFIPREDGGIEKLLSSLQRWTDTNPQEKVYLHMDKPYYALGDTLWFKTYVTIGSRHQLSAQSQALYVELISERDSLLQTLKLPLIAGMAMGSFTLDDELNEGNYRVRAYTQWMRNAGEDYFFDKTFAVGSPGGDEVQVKVDYQYELGKGKPMVLAHLNYKDDDGKPLSDKNVRYELILNDKVIYNKESETDMSGNIIVRIANDEALQSGNGFLRTTVYTKDRRKLIKTFPIKAALARSDLQFFPEGGTLVGNITSRIAFKAVGVDGAGIVVKGIVIDQLGKEVTSFESQHAGMGSFLLKPEAGKQYIAKVIYKDSSTAEVNLPVAQPEGYTLSVYQLDNDSLLVRLTASAGLTKSPQGLGLIVQSGGETVYASKVLTNRQINSVRLPKKSFPTGIAQFTLFDYKNEPISERIVFVRNQDQMKVKIKTAKKSYNSREKVEVELESTDPTGKPVAGNFSVAVIDESKVPIEEQMESTIFSNILLTSDLKGYIEKPNYYFTAENDAVNRALDNLMLTQGYRRFSWKEITKTGSKSAEAKPVFKAEKLGMDISGKVLTLGDQPLPDGKVTLMSLKAGIVMQAITDSAGKFRFEDLVLQDSLRFAVQATSANNRKNVQIMLDSIERPKLTKNKNFPDMDTDIAGSIDSYLENSQKQDAQMERMGKLNRVQRLKEVMIRGKQWEKHKYATQGMMRIPEGHADQTYVLERPEKCGTLGVCLQGMLTGIVFRPLVRNYSRVNNYPYLGTVPMQVILNGRVIDNIDEVAEIFDQNIVDPRDIAKIEVVRTSLALKAMLGAPSIMIITKKNRSPRIFLNVVNLSRKGFNKVREFYSPKYDYSNANSQVPDLRSTVYWNANVKTHGLGKSTFSYHNADGPGRYKMIVEGINAAGELARAVYRYEVSAGGATTATANTSSPMVQGFVKVVDSVRQRLPIEKVYLHTDKSYYNLGDTLWFKSYLMNGTGLAASSISGLLYVELLNDSADVVRRISIPVAKGLGWAQIPLPRTIFHEGAYTLRAYTNWMQNFDEDYFFTRRFYLGVPTGDTWLVKSGTKVSTVEGKDLLDVNLGLSRSDLTPAGLRDVEVRLMEGDRLRDKEIVQTRADGGLSLKYELKDRFDGRNMRVEIRNVHKNDGNQQLSVPLVVSRNQDIDLQFLPEGGHMVAGLSCVVGFKALGEDGKGIQVEGEIIDSKGIKVSTFASFYRGMGSFEFTPQAGEIYTARLLLTGAVKNYPLPLVKPVGTVINVRNVEEADSIKVSIFISDKVFNPADSWFLTALSGGRITYMEPVSPSALTHVISKRQFPSGLTRFTLLKNRIPLNERLVFVDHLDRLQIGMETDKPNYYKRDSVSLAIYVKDADGQPVKGNFSLAVTDDTQVRSDSTGNNDIGTTLLLTTELKGKVETPGYYLSRKDKESWKALDNLMLTQGWTNYQWADIFSKPETPAFEPELKLKITGTVTNIFNKPIKGAQMLISSQKPAFLASTLSDTAGRYRFDNLPEIDSGSFFIQARTPKGRSMNFGEVTVESFKPPVIETRYRDQIAPWYVDTDPVQLNYVKNVLNGGDETRLRNSGIALKEVKVHAKKVIKGAYKVFREPDMAFDEQDIKESAAMSLYQILRQKLPGFKVVSEEGMPTAKFNKYIVDIFADGNAIPIRMNSNFDVADLLQQLNSTMIASFVGIAVYYSKQGGIGVKGAFANANLQAIHAAQHKLRSRGSDYYLHARTVLAQTSARQYEFATIHITTKFRTGGVYNNNPDFATLRPVPIMHPQEFYSPGYGAAENADKADYRATVYWAPDIVTDSQGKAIVSFYTADIPGTYTLNIQGSDMKGSLGSGSSKLKIITQVK
ncbi:carboxypeptidase-like regulatory domain-containing protein [Pedobacter psychroterrae]|uniref:MG2 domain-containing protein n=1 Tax=Pedobacter psychroterrae TaxID=2530453 RepID=A0A4R0NMA4_9SPHI|nr:carboxypeptidase-like regulatory domain-containing protein [Pedobacter psychroterrae]TCD00185.1 hypothetical protein EZ437_15845 [Pedobacter psychroterrae]